MKTVGIVAEYNPFHAGHRKQFDRIRAEFGRETAIVCAMSGNYVQRGAPAVMDKTLRAKAAVACGADLVVELPTTVSLSSAEGFARSAAMAASSSSVYRTYSVYVSSSSHASCASVPGVSTTQRTSRPPVAGYSSSVSICPAASNRRITLCFLKVAIK